MTGKNLKRRNFIQMCGVAAAGSTLPFFPVNFFSLPGSGNNTYKRSIPRWIIYDNGTFDFISQSIILKNCRPAIDDQTLVPRNVFLGDSPRGTRIMYELPGGFVMLDLQTNSDSVSIGVEFSGFSRTPRWFFPIAQAEVFGATRFFRQGYGTGGPSGVYPIVPPGQDEDRPEAHWQTWSYDSYLAFALMGEEETIAIGNADQNDFLQRSTIYSHRHRQRLKDREEGDGKIFFEAAMLLNQTPVKDEYAKLPELYFYAGNKPLETMQELVMRTASRTKARPESAPGYYWISNSGNTKPNSFYHLKEQIDFLVKQEPPLHLQSLVVNRGYCTIGDWLEPNENWPGGLRRAAREIFKHGYRAGIWIAPFLADEKSNLFKNHPDWVIKDFENRAIPEKTEEGTFYTLDATRNEVKNYLRNVFRNLSRMGFLFYQMDYLEWGVKDAYLVRKAETGKSSVQVFRETMEIIREEIGNGSLVMADRTAFGPVTGVADMVQMAHTGNGGWAESGVENMIRETYYGNYFNNILWQNNPGEIDFMNNAFTEDEKISLGLWKAILGGTVCTTGSLSGFTPEQLRFFRFLEPGKRFRNVTLPYWPSSGEIKIAVRKYDRQKSWGVLFFNDKNEPVNKSYPVSRLIEKEAAWVFSWWPKVLLPYGWLPTVNVVLEPHQSQLFWISENNLPPPGNFTLGGRFTESFF